MECTSCGYTLWNLNARQCPECGAGFKPGDFEFISNSVRFCCPTCDQAYYGTGEKGHLVPAEFDCVKCGTHVHMDTMVLRIAEGVSEESTRVDENPWLNRQRVGRVKGWFKTVGMALVSPGKLMLATPLGSSHLQGWWFMLITLMIGTLMSFAALSCFIGPMMMAIPTPNAGGAIAPVIGSILATGVGITVALLVGVAIWGCVLHGILLLTGQTAAGIGRSMQAVCYSSGAFALTAVPCVGFYVGGPWWLICSVIAVMAAQRVSGWRASLAVLALPLLVVIAYAAFIVVAITASTAQVTAWQTGFGGAAETVSMSNYVQAYAANNNGSGPTHAMELVGANAMSESDFVSADTATSPSVVVIGDQTLLEVMTLPPNLKRMAIDDLVAAMPPNVVAHRVGDWVYTYHGIDLNNADPRLWVLVLVPDPSVNGTGGEFIALADGTVTPALGNFAQLLAQQNAVRAELNLPPLPDLIMLGDEPATSDTP